MGVGKTRIGKKISQMMNVPFIDIDQEIEKNENKSISKIFKENGEGYFRKLETNFIHSFNYSKKMVVSCGGGLPCHSNNMDIIIQKSHSLYLQKDFETLILKLEKEKKSRPMINFLGKENFYKKNKALYQERIPFYNKSSFHLKVDSLWKENFMTDIYTKL